MVGDLLLNLHVMEDRNEDFRKWARFVSNNTNEGDLGLLV